MQFRCNPDKGVMLWGDSGIGKTELIHQIGRMTERKVFVFQTNIREPVDVRGIPVPNLEARTTEWLVPSELPKADGSDGPSILFIDEINTGGVQMMAVMMQLVIAPHVIGDYRLPDNCRIVAAGNRMGDSRAVQQMPKPLRGRFTHYTMVVDYDAWDDHAKVSGLAPEIRAFVKFRKVDGVLYRQPVGAENAYANPRSVYGCGAYVNEPAHLRAKAFIGNVGHDVGTEMEGFVSMYQSFTTLDQILADPENAPVPTEPSHIYGVAAALSNLADRKNFANVITYADRLPADIGTMCVLTAVERDNKLTSVAAYGKWTVANSHVTLGDVAA
jgi:hypothetical protein